MKHLSFIKSFTKADWKAFIIFTILNILHFPLSLYSGGIIALFISGDFSPDFAAEITAKCIVAVFVTIFAGWFIRKLHVWLLSLPFQFVLGCLLFKWVYSPLNVYWLTTINWVGTQIVAQAIGVFIGLYVRKHHIRK